MERSQITAGGSRWKPAGKRRFTPFSHDSGGRNVSGSFAVATIVAKVVEYLIRGLPPAVICDRHYRGSKLQNTN